MEKLLEDSVPCRVRIQLRKDLDEVVAGIVMVALRGSREKSGLHLNYLPKCEGKTWIIVTYRLISDIGPSSQSQPI